MNLPVIETYTLGNRKVLVVKNHKTMSRDDLNKFWLGNTINGHKVLGVESHTTMTIPEGSNIGLMIIQ